MAKFRNFADEYMIERIVIIDQADPVSFYGVNNSNMQLVRNLFPKLRMAARGSVIKVIGDDAETAEFEKKIKELEAYCAKYNKLTEEVILDIVKGEKPRDIKGDDVIIYGVNLWRRSSTMTSLLRWVRPERARPTWPSPWPCARSRTGK